MARNGSWWDRGRRRYRLLTIFTRQLANQAGYRLVLRNRMPPTIVLVGLAIVLFTMGNTLVSTADITIDPSVRMERRFSDDNEVPPFQNRICRSTFQLSHITGDFLLFSAPPPSNTLPEALVAWKEEMQSTGSLVIFTNGDHGSYESQGVYTMCVEHTDDGLPRFDRMMERMYSSLPQGVVAFVNSDVFPEHGTFERLKATFAVIEKEPLELMQPMELFQPFTATGNRSDAWFALSIRMDVDQKGNKTHHRTGGFDFWAFNVGNRKLQPLLPISIPPFRFPYATYDNWLLDMMIQTAQRNVIDVSPVITLLHHQHKRVGSHTSWTEVLEKGVSGAYINKYLAHSKPDYLSVRHVWSFGHPPEAPYEATRDDTGVQLLRRKYWSNVPNVTRLDPSCLQKSYWDCKLIRTIEKKTEIFESTFQGLPLADPFRGGKIARMTLKNWRYTIEHQLRRRATSSGFVLLTAVNYEYREHLRNFVCNIERVGISSHFVIAALDMAVYRWGVEQGLPVFLPKAVLKANSRFVSDGYDGAAFRSLTKLKSIVVLEVLHQGYSLVWSDVDITWFAHPFAALAPYMKEDSGVDFVIQSNSPFLENPRLHSFPHPTVTKNLTSTPHNSTQRINSGLYMARNTAAVRAAFGQIVSHGKTSSRTEQYSFDFTLCNAKYNREDKSFCRFEPRRSLWRSIRNIGTRSSSSMQDLSLNIYFLHRFEYPNGAVLVGPENRNVFNTGRVDFEMITNRRLFAAHNNWIVGEEAKQNRQREAGWWFAEGSNGCVYLGESVG